MKLSRRAVIIGGGGALPLVPAGAAKKAPKQKQIDPDANNEAGDLWAMPPDTEKDRDDKT